MFFVFRQLETKSEITRFCFPGLKYKVPESDQASVPPDGSEFSAGRCVSGLVLQSPHLISSLWLCPHWSES